MVDVKHLVGTTFRGWTLTEILGNGGSAIVYGGQNGERQAAVKVFFPDALEKHGYGEELGRLELQLQLRGTKQHENLVEIYDGGQAEELDNTLFLVMERITGKTLDKVLDALPRKAIPSLMKQLAGATKYLEDQNLTHRDIKPENIAVSDDFTRLTLLDLGIVKNLVSDEAGRLSGNRFVSTPRYSPPEFVWRSEAESADAWRAITFYQIGATLHDLIMRRRIFDGEDQPVARLYDAIRLVSPTVEASDCESWLVFLAKCCLVKDWRERLRLVSWESFSGPAVDDLDLGYQTRLIRLRQIRRDEIAMAEEAAKRATSRDERVKELWNLQDKLFLDTRSFLHSAEIFPRFGAIHSAKSETDYQLLFEFDPDKHLGFDNKLTLQIRLRTAPDFGHSTEISIISNYGGELIFQGEWVEPLTIESASSIVKRTLLQVAEKLVPQA